MHALQQDETLLLDEDTKAQALIHACDRSTKKDLAEDLAPILFKLNLHDQLLVGIIVFVAIAG